MGLVRPSTFGNPLLKDYVLDSTYDEVFTEDGLVRPHYAEVLETFLNLPPEEIARRKRSVDLSFMTQGITFNVYGHEAGTEKIWPPRGSASSMGSTAVDPFRSPSDCDQPRISGTRKMSARSL